MQIVGCGLRKYLNVDGRLSNVECGLIMQDPWLEL